jgi:hypothetical protein
MSIRMRWSFERERGRASDNHLSWLFPVSQVFQLIYDFDQSLKPPLIIACCGTIFRAEQILAVRFGEF